MGRFTGGLFATPPAPGSRLFQDMNAAGEAIEQRAGQSFRAEAPFEHYGQMITGRNPSAAPHGSRP